MGALTRHPAGLQDRPVRSDGRGDQSAQTGPGLGRRLLGPFRGEIAQRLCCSRSRAWETDLDRGDASPCLLGGVARGEGDVGVDHLDAVRPGATTTVTSGPWAPNGFSVLVCAPGRSTAAWIGDPSVGSSQVVRPRGCKEDGLCRGEDHGGDHVIDDPGPSVPLLPVVVCSGEGPQAPGRQVSSGDPAGAVPEDRPLEVSPGRPRCTPPTPSASSSTSSGRVCCANR